MSRPFVAFLSARACCKPMDLGRKHHLSPHVPPRMTIHSRVVSVDVGGTKIACALMRYESADAAPQAHGINPCPPRCLAAARRCSSIVGVAAAAMEASVGLGLKVLGIGVGTAGRVDAKTGSIAYANEIMPGWTGQLVQRLRDARASVAVLGDVQAHAARQGPLGRRRTGADVHRHGPGYGAWRRHHCQRTNRARLSRFRGRDRGDAEYAARRGRKPESVARKRNRGPLSCPDGALPERRGHFFSCNDGEEAAIEVISNAGRSFWASRLRAG